MIFASIVLAWVLWSNVKPLDKPQAWMRISATETKRECEDEQGRMVEMLHRQKIVSPDDKRPTGIVRRTPTGEMYVWWLYQCWPDTVDPSR